MGETARRTGFKEAYWPEKKELAYGDPIEDAESGAYAGVFQGEPFQRTPELGTDVAMTGKGHEFEGQQTRQVMAWDARVTRQLPLDTRVAGWLLSHGFGTVSSVNNADGSYLHTIEPLAPATGVQLPSSSRVVESVHEGLKRKFSGLVVNDFSISGSKGQWLQCGYTLIGDGSADEATALTIPAITVASPLKFTAMTKFHIGAAGSAITQLPRLNGFTFNWANNLMADDGYLANSTEVDGGPKRSKLEMGVRVPGLQLIMDAGRGANLEYTAMKGQTLYEVELIARGALIAGSNYHEVRLHLAECYIDNATPGVDGDKQIYTLDITPRYDLDTDSPVVAKVQNDQANLLVAAA